MSRPPKLYQQVAERLTAAIRGGAHPPGSRLPSERDLAESLGVSRPTVREAITALEIQGFVSSRQGSGVYVNESQPQGRGGRDLDVGAFELTEARRAVEPEVAALAATAITDAQLAELERAVADMRRENDTGAAGEQADRRFHLAIAEATRNTALVATVEHLWDLRHTSPLCLEMLSRARSAGDLPRIEEHLRILAALRARDSAAARAAMRDHLSRVIEGLLAATEHEVLEAAKREAAQLRERYARRGAA